ncbi:LIC_10091 family protein [Nannocystis pusilla]|uniref:LIC_10091 family protein n=1 Tax=Nannocystis pusilla TaxID=889268 RepID=UPI003DA2416C
MYLQRVREEQAGSWSADPDAYTYVRKMFAAGRIRVLQGNLTGRTTMADIAVAARALASPVTVLYLSNAEDYLFYTDRFAANVAALPSDARSVLLRTIHDRFPGWESAEGDARWNYQVQALPDFQRRLGERSHGRNQDRTSMLAAALAAGAVERKARGVSVIALHTAPPSGGGDLLMARAGDSDDSRRD